MAGRRPPHNQRPPSRPRRPDGHTGRRPRHEQRFDPRTAYEGERLNLQRGSGKVGMSFSATVVAALFFGFVLVYMAWQAYGFFEPSVATEVVRIGSMEAQRSVPGLIIRDETVSYAERDGRVVFAVGDFERVRERVHVASIQDADAVYRNDRALFDIEEEIRIVHEWRPFTQSDPAVQTINNHLRNRMDGSKHNFARMNLAEIYALQEWLALHTANRNQIIIRESGDVRDEIGRQHDLHMSHRETIHIGMYAPRSGIMSPIVDGYEDRFTPDAMESLTREDTLHYVDFASVVPARDVEEGDPVFKIVGNNWYVAAFMPNEMIQGFEENQHRTIFLENAATGQFEPINMRIEMIERRHNDSLVIFRSTRNVIEFLNQRNVNIRTTDNVQRGLKIPTSAIAAREYLRIPATHVHNDSYVRHRRDGILHQMPIDIIEQTPYYVYVLREGLGLILGDSIASVLEANPDHVLTEADERTVHGVYRTNFGVADFREIVLDDEMTETDVHVLLCQTRNRGRLHQFDTIVTDASTVRQGDIVQ